MRRHAGAAALALLLWCGSVQAASITVAWDGKPDERASRPDGTPCDPCIYRVKWGPQPGQYPHSLETQGMTATIPDLEPGSTIYVLVVAADPQGEYQSAGPLQVRVPLAATNLLPNGSMEEGLWTSGAFASTRPQGVWDSAEVAEGSRSAKMLGPDASTRFYGYWISPEAPVTAGRRYRIAWRYRLQDVTELFVVRYEWRRATGGSNLSSGELRPQVRGTQPWTEDRAEVLAPEGAAALRLQVRTASTGGASWLDDVRIEAVEDVPPPYTPVAPGPIRVRVRY